MVTPELISYIREQIAKGRNSETIKTALLNQKWNEMDINEAFSQIGTSQNSQNLQGNNQTIVTTTKDTTSEKLSKKSLVIILLLIFLYPIGLLCMYFLTKWKWWVKLLITLPLILMAIIFGLSILSVNPQEAIEKAEKLKTLCSTKCSNEANYDACYNQCVSDRKQIE